MTARARICLRDALPTLCALAALLAFTAWVYWPGISGPEMLDDRSSVLVIGDLQEKPELAWDYVFGDRSGPLGRTVSMATFVLEKLYFDDGMAGHKRVNILLHCVNGALLVWLLTLLLRRLQSPGANWLALALGAVWLLHPLLVSSVLYVVQRMAMLSATFMLASIISYVYWRAGVRRGHYRPVAFLPVLAFFALGMLAKENTIVLLPLLLLLEVLWFQCRDGDGELLPGLRRTSYTLIAGGAAGATLVLLLSLDYLAGRFHKRPFSMEERLLTQARILWDYIGQWFGPDTARMGLYHDDVAWSQSLTEPISTLFALLGWLAVVLAAAVLLRWRWTRFLVFGAAWFLVAHAVESTVWPLELYFEHRNYFPAIGLLLMLGVLFAMLVRRWPQPAAPLLVILCVCALALSLQASYLVQVWSNRHLLVLHHYNGHPQSSRANLDMATQMATLGSIEAARRYSARAFEVSFVEREGDLAVRDLALACIAGAPVTRQQIDRVGAVDASRPLSSVTTLLTLVRMLQDDACEQFDRYYFADHLADIYLHREVPASASTNMYSNLAVLENALQRYELALAYNDKVLQKRPASTRALLMKLHFTSALGMAAERAQTIAALQALDRQGKLSVGEQQTLSLYPVESQ